MVKASLPLLLRWSLLPLLCLLVGCGSDEEAADNRGSADVKIINTSGSTFTLDFTAQNRNYDYQLGADRYPTHTLTLPPGSTTTFTAYAMDKDSSFCEILLHLNDDTKGLIYFADGALHTYTIKPGLLGASGSG